MSECIRTFFFGSSLGRWFFLTLAAGLRGGESLFDEEPDAARRLLSCFGGWYSSESSPLSESASTCAGSPWLGDCSGVMAQ